MICQKIVDKVASYPQPGRYDDIMRHGLIHAEAQRGGGEGRIEPGGVPVFSQSVQHVPAGIPEHFLAAGVVHAVVHGHDHLSQSLAEDPALVARI